MRRVTDMIEELPDRILEVRMRLNELTARGAAVQEETDDLDKELTLALELQKFLERLPRHSSVTHNRTWLTDAQQREIRLSTESAAVLAERMHISMSTIWRIRRKRPPLKVVKPA